MQRPSWTRREEGGCLISAGAMNWPAADTERIYVSQSYQELFARCELLFEHVQGVFLKGTPGIGKSCFLDYVLHRYLNNGKKVLYVSGPRDWVYTFYPDGTFDKNYDVKKTLIGIELANDEDIDIVLFDPHKDSAKTLDFQKSHFHGKKFIVAMSPDPEHCKKLVKTSQTSKATLYMGTLSLQEAEAMRAACYPHMLLDLLRTRYEVMAGIPRYLFGTFLPSGVDEAKNEVEQRQLRALNEAVEHPLQIDGGEVASEFKHLWSLYHIQPVSTAGVTDYHRYTIEICCDDARTKLRIKLMEKNVMELWRLYRDTVEQHGGLRGLRYEAFAHKKILSEGLNGRATSLTQRGTGTGSLPVNIPASLQKIVLPDNDVGPRFRAAINQATQSTDGLYVLPQRSNFPVVDSIFASSTNTTPLQMKAGRSKPLSDTYATTIFNVLGDVLVFVVPDEVVLPMKLRGGPAGLRQYRFILNETED